MSPEIRTSVIEEIIKTFEQEGVIFNEAMLEMGVMEIGVDSLTYAVLVTRLQNKLKRDPFTDNPNLGYPKTLNEFISAYLI